MTLTPDLLDAMIANGLTREQIVALAKVGIAAQVAEAEAKEAKRKERQNERQARRRRLSGVDVTHSMRDNVDVTVTGVTERDTSAPSLDGRPPSPTPQPPTLKPSPTTGSDPGGSAEADASAPRAPELSLSDRIWVEFPTVLGGMSGRSDRSVRTWLGKVLKKYRHEDVLAALRAAVEARTGDPFGYVIRVLNPVQPKQARAPPRQSSADLWAADAVDARLSRQRDPDEPGHRDTPPSGPHLGRPAGRTPKGSADGLSWEQPGADSRQLQPLRLVGGSRADG